MNLEEVINKHFPYNSYNPGQFKAIHDSIQFIMSSPKKHIVLSCPTGVGKSVIAMTIHNVLEELNSGCNTVILATTKGLQDQYNKDFPDLIDLKGKSNYFCHHNISEGYRSAKCVEKVKSGQCSKDKCPYVIARDTWTGHDSVKTTNSALMIASQLVNPETPADLCVIDECHEIDKVIISSSVLTFNIEDYPEMNKHYTDFKNSYYEIILLLKTRFPTAGSFLTVEKLTKEEYQNLKDFLESIREMHKKIKDGISSGLTVDFKFILLSQELADIKSKLDCIVGNNFINLEWVMDNEVDDATGISTIILTPIQSSGVLANSKLFCKAEKFLHMSATIGGIETYCKNLGIKSSDVNYIEIDNPIPVSSRKVILTNLTKINRFTNTSDIVKAIMPIIENESGNGIIHTVSFKLANDIFYAMPHHIRKRMLVSNNRKEILELLAKKSDAIVLSPSVETGYDFKDDLARWQIIAKVPFLNLGDNYTKTRMNKSNDWYVREAVLRIVQSCGRIVRGMSDYGTTYIIDENILRIITSNTSMFPSWWLDALDMED